MPTHQPAPLPAAAQPASGHAAGNTASYKAGHSTGHSSSTPARRSDTTQTMLPAKPAKPVIFRDFASI